MVNHYQKPATVTFTFNQKRYDKSGAIVDDRGQMVYKLHDESEEHSFGFAKAYPMQILRTNNQLAATIDWHSAPAKSTISGLGGKRGDVLLLNGLMNSDLNWAMADGSRFEWDGVWGSPFNLLDYRIQQPYSITPASVAKYSPAKSKHDYAHLEVLRDALNVPGFLDYLVTTVLWLEFNLNCMVEKKGNSASVAKIANAMGKAGASLADGGGGDGGGGGGDGGGGGGA